jgi:hypothetical protein
MVKASQVYVFEYAKAVATVNGDAAKPLYTAEGNLSNRKLAANTSWKTDRTIQLNGQTFYRLQLTNLSVLRMFQFTNHIDDTKRFRKI